MSQADDGEDLADLWARYAKPPALDRTRVCFGEPFFTPLERFYARQLRPHRGPGRVLEIGCGYSRNLCYLATAQTTRALGVDVSAGAITGARRHAVAFASCPQIDFLVSSMADLKEADWDLVVATQVINYFDSPHEFLQQVTRLLAPGGILLLSDAQRPNRSPSTRLKETATVRRAFGKPALAPASNRVHHHAHDEVLRAAGEHGFVCRSVTFAGHLPYRLVVDDLHGVWLRSFPRPALRRAARAGYVVVARLVDALARWSARRPGDLYFLVLVAPRTTGFSSPSR